MTLTVRFFAKAREIAGADRVELNVRRHDGNGRPATVSDLRAALADYLPAMRPLVPSLLFAVGTDYADDDTPLHADSEIACFPPVSGG